MGFVTMFQRVTTFEGVTRPTAKDGTGYLRFQASGRTGTSYRTSTPSMFIKSSY